MWPGTASVYLSSGGGAVLLNHRRISCASAMSSSVSPARSAAHAALNFALQSSRSVPEAGGNRVAVRRGMAGMSDHYFLDDDGTTIIHCGGGARPQDTHLASTVHCVNEEDHPVAGVP